MKKVICLIVFIIFFGMGCFFYTKYMKADNKPNNVEDKPNNTGVTNPTYDETKNIKISGKSYRVGLKKYGSNYDIDKIPDEGTGVIELYINDDKVKTILYKIDSVNPSDVIVKIEPHKFSSKYILVSIMYSDGIKIKYNDFYVFDLSLGFVGYTTWNGSYEMKEVSTSKLLTYEINSDSLIIYDSNTLTKDSYTIVDNALSKKTLKTYTKDEIRLINK